MATTISDSLRSYVNDTAPDAPAPSRLTTLINERTTTEDETSLQAVALQVLHNLQYEHTWTELQIHTKSPIAPFRKLPRPLVSGLPPQRLYIHPDEQIELLKEAKKRKHAAQQDTASGPNDATAAQLKKDGLDLQAQPQREWVLPTRLNEKWSLRRMAGIFAEISLVPPNTILDPAAIDMGSDILTAANKWRLTKRVLMAIADHDSTVVYYIVQDGIVKPRQN